jgi:lysozyme family protein
MSNLPESLPLGASVPFSPAFLHAINFVLPHEEEFARGHWGDENYVIAEHDPHDPGGATKFGIDQRSHPNIDIEHLTRDQAIAIYYQEWRFYHIFLLPERIAIAQFDVRVNGGHAVAWLQRAINAVGHLSLKVDGVLGPATINAANTVNETPVLRYFINERDQRFAALAADNANFASFLKGWLQRDRDLRAYLCV